MSIRDLKFKQHKWIWVPSGTELGTVGPTNYPTTGGIMNAHRGTLVIYAAIQINLAFSAGTPTVSMGDSGDPNGLVLTTDVTIGTAGTYPGVGDDLVSVTGVSNANGKLYTTETDIIIRYTGDALTTVGRLTAIITYCEIE
jgi:hypothetical protein